MHATMEHMTIWGLISDASLLVKGVMLTLLLASLLSWFLIVRRSAILRAVLAAVGEGGMARPGAGQVIDGEVLDRGASTGKPPRGSSRRSSGRPRSPRR